MGERMAVLETKVDDIKRDINEIKDLLKRNDNKYALKEDVKDLQSRFYWILGVLITMLLALKFVGLL